VTAQLSAHCDFISISAHKIGGPKGVGALIARVGLVERLRPLIRGGGQERRLRAGTENVAAVAGFGAACAALHREGSTERERVRRLRDRLEDALREITPGAVVVGARADRLPNTTCVALPGRRSDTLVIGLDLEGVAVSAGAACSSGRIERSHVLAAMGLADDIAASAVRISLGWSTSEADIEQFIGAWRRVAGHRPVRAAVA
jgi:cysteine desulfurase